MRQAIAPVPFISVVISSTQAPPVSGRWAGVRGLPPEVVRTVAALVYRTGATHIMLRTRSRLIFTNSRTPQEPGSLVLFAAYLLLTNESGFPTAYASLLNALAANRPQAELDTAMRAASKALISGCKTNLGLDRIQPKAASSLVWVWFYAVKDVDVIPELFATAGRKLTALLGNPAEYAAYLAGKSAAFGSVKIK
jgi:hypothetical protein